MLQAQGRAQGRAGRAEVERLECCETLCCWTTLLCPVHGRLRCPPTHCCAALPPPAADSPHGQLKAVSGEGGLLGGGQVDGGVGNQGVQAAAAAAGAGRQEGRQRRQGQRGGGDQRMVLRGSQMQTSRQEGEAGRSTIAMPCSLLARWLEITPRKHPRRPLSHPPVLEVLHKLAHRLEGGEVEVHDGVGALGHAQLLGRLLSLGKVAHRHDDVPVARLGQGVGGVETQSGGGTCRVREGGGGMRGCGVRRGL